jgi:hypothetical protein
MPWVELTLTNGRKASFNVKNVIAVVQNKEKSTLYTLTTNGITPPTWSIAEPYAEVLAKLASA